jgi:hypothetical protein
MQSIWGKTTCRSFSEYARKVLTEEPVSKTYRNVSLDALIVELNELRNQLQHLVTDNPGAGEIELIKSILDEVKLIGNKIIEQCILQ